MFKNKLILILLLVVVVFLGFYYFGYYEEVDILKSVDFKKKNRDAREDYSNILRAVWVSEIEDNKIYLSEKNFYGSENKDSKKEKIAIVNENTKILEKIVVIPESQKDSSKATTTKKEVNFSALKKGLGVTVYSKENINRKNQFEASKIIIIARKADLSEPEEKQPKE